MPVLISVIIPFYSNIDWLIEATESIINQTYKEVEIIVINDGSKEDVSGFLSNYESKLKYFYKENGGPATARNYGIRKATGDYIAFLDSDDIWLPRKLELQYDYMLKNGYKWSQHSYEYYDGKEKIKKIDTSIYEGNVLPFLFTSCRVQTSCFMICRDILTDGIEFDEGKRFGEDAVFYRKLGEQYELGSCPEYLGLFRIRSGNAGFNPIVQINSRAETWQDNKKSIAYIDNTNASTRLAYKWCVLFSKLLHKFGILNPVLCKIIYLPPWIVFRQNSIKLARRKRLNKN